MIIRPKDRRHIMISGIFVAVGILMSAGFVFMLGAESSMFATKVTLKTSVKNSQSLKPGAAVRLKGIKIGAISKLGFADVNTINLEMSVLEDYLEYIKTDSYISIKTQGVLGDKYLEILGGGKDLAAIKPGSFITTKEESLVDKFINQGEDILKVTGRILVKFDAILSKIPEDRMSNIIESVETSSRSTERILSSIKPKSVEKLFDKLSDLSENLSDSSNELNKITSQITSGPGTLHSLIYDRTVHDDIRALLGGGKRNKVLRYFIRESIKRSDY